MTIATIDLAQSFGLSETELLRQALLSFLQEKRRQALGEQSEIFARYQASTPAELEAKIVAGEVAEHPGWEDLITTENLAARLEKINTLLAGSPPGHSPEDRLQ